MRPCGLGDLICASQVDVHNLVPLLVIHIGKRLVPKDSRIVDNNVQSAECINSRLDDNVAVLSRSLIPHCRAACLLDFSDDRVRADEVIDDYGCAQSCKEKRIRPTKPAVLDFY